MNFRHILAALAATVLAGIGAASAQMVSEPRELIGFNFEDLETLAADAGWGSYRADDGTSEVLVITIDGRKLVLWPRACSSEGRCGGLYVFALVPFQASSALTNAFNVKFNPARATIRDGQVVLDRYLIGDFGVVRGSLWIDLQAQAKMIDDWWEFAEDNRVRATAVSFNPLLAEKWPENETVSSHFDEIKLSPALLDQVAAGNGPRD